MHALAGSFFNRHALSLARADGLGLLARLRFQGLFHSPRRGAFHRSLAVLSAIGRCRYFALGSGLPCFRRPSTRAAVLAYHPTRPEVFAYGALTLSGSRFPVDFGSLLSTPAATLRRCPV